MSAAKGRSRAKADLRATIPAARAARAAAPRRRQPGVRIAGGGKDGGDPIRFVIPSDLAASGQVQQQILCEIRKCGYNEHSLFAVQLCLEEALINAIRHGNKLDPSKQVRIEASITPKKAQIIIEDEGPGFDRKSVPDPTAEENLGKNSGRGILLIESYMNHVRWSRGGRRVRMVKINGKEAG